MAKKINKFTQIETKLQHIIMTIAKEVHCD